MRRWRWLGFAGSALVAAAAYVVGANVGTVPARSAALSTRASHLIALAGWLAGTVLLVAAWLALRPDAGAPGPDAGAPGHPARQPQPDARQPRTDAGRRPPAPLRWLAATAALWALPLLAAPPVGSRDVFAYACQGYAYAHGLDPYAVGAQAASCRWLAAVPAIWRATPAPYGPLWLPLAGAAAAAAGTSLWAAVVAFRILALAGTGLAGWSAWRLARRCAVAPAGALWLGLASPLVLVHAVSGGHNDALATGLVLAGLAVAASGSTGGAQPEPVFGGGEHPPRSMAGWRWWLPAAGAGALFALGLAVKVVAVVAAPFALLIAARRGGRSLPASTLPFLAAGAACYAALSAASGLGLGWVSALRHTTSLVEWTSPPTGVGMAFGYLLRLLGVPHGYAAAVAVARTVAAALLAAVLVALWWRARRAGTVPDVIRLAGVALAATAVLGPVFYPWYALTALALLACCTRAPRVRTGLAVVTACLVFLVLPDGYGLAVPTKLPGALLDLAAAVAAVTWLVSRRGIATRPASTVDGEAVPAAGAPGTDNR